MKILKICGIAVGLHALAFILIFSNPGCSSSRAQDKPAPTTVEAPTPAPAPDAALKPDSSPPLTVPNISGGAAAADAPLAPAPAPDAASSAPLFSPTRPGTAAAAALQAQPAAGVTPATTYAVSSGDSLWSIAKKNHLKVSALAAANNLKAGASLHLGQKLIIPSAAPSASPAETEAAPAPAAAPAGVGAPPTTVGAPAAAGSTKYVVRPGETLGTIARKHGVRLGDLARENNISDPQKIHPGQTLVIPASRPGAHAAHAAKPAAGSAPKAPPADTAAPAPTTVGAPVAPPPGQDLDAGLKPGDASAPPVIKVEDGPAKP